MTDLIAAHLDFMTTRRYAPESIRLAASVLRQAARLLPSGIGDVHPDEIAGFLAAGHRKAWSLRTYDTTLRRYFAWAYAAGLMSADPMSELPRAPLGPQIPNPVSMAVVALALERCVIHGMWHTAIMLATYAGLRADEIAQLDRQDVTAEWVMVRRGKGGRPGLVDTAPVLWEYLRDRPPGRLVLNRRGNAVTGQWLSTCQHRHFVRCGLPELHLHRFRHTFATELLRAGTDIRTVQELMRHRSLLSTMGYTAVAGDQRRRAVAALPELGTRKERRDG